MTQPRYKVTWKTLALTAAGITAFIVYIYVFNVDLTEIIDTMKTIDLNIYMLAAVVAVLDTLFFTFAWHSLLRFLKVRVSLLKSFLFVWVGIFVDDLIPAESVSGEIAKIYLINKEHDGTAGKATASVIAQRLIGVTINVATLVIGASLLVAESLLYGWMLMAILLITGISIAFLGLILLLCGRERWTLKIVDSLIRFGQWITRGKWTFSKIREEVIESAKQFHIAMREYSRAPKTLLAAALFSTISWILALVVFYLTLSAIPNAQIGWSAILVVSAIFMAVKSVPIGVPFEVGLPEVTLTTLLMFFTGNMPLSATLTILIRVPTFWLKFVVGFAAQQFVGLSVMSKEKERIAVMNPGLKT